MATPARSTTSTAIAADRPADLPMVRHAIAVLGPSWHTWFLQTLAQHPDGMRLADLENALPFVASGSRHNTLTRLTRAGLIDRPDSPHRSGTRLYRITDLGRAALPVHQRAADWARIHLCPGEQVPLAEAAEIGLTQIMGTHTLDTLAAVRAADTATAPDLAAVRPHVTRADHANYLSDAFQLGLLDRVGRGRYTLSAAARDLDPVLDALADFAVHRTPTAASARPHAATEQYKARLTMASQQAAAAPPVPSRTAAASTPSQPTNPAAPRTAPTAATAKAPRHVPAVVFSHPDHPRAPAAPGATGGRGRW